MSKSNQNNIVTAMKNSKGRFFSLATTTSRRRINAQFVEETPKTVVIYDRNRYSHCRINKSSLTAFEMGGVTVG